MRLTNEPHRLIYRTSRWKQARARALARDGYACVDCGETGRLEAHHVIPLAQGGSPTRLANLVTVCPRCHHRREEGSRA